MLSVVALHVHHHFVFVLSISQELALCAVRVPYEMLLAESGADKTTLMQLADKLCIQMHKSLKLLRHFIVLPKPDWHASVSWAHLLAPSLLENLCRLPGSFASSDTSWPSDISWLSDT